jgi:hypothetical protein
VLVPGKAPIWLKSTGRAFFDEEGRMLRLIGMVADVTDEKLKEEALSDATRNSYLISTTSATICILRIWIC